MFVMESEKEGIKLQQLSSEGLLEKQKLKM